MEAKAAQTCLKTIALQQNEYSQFEQITEEDVESGKKKKNVKNKRKKIKVY